MAAQPSPSSAIHLSKLSSKTAIHDVGTVLTSVSQFSLLRKGLLFISTPLYLATHTDQEILREGLKTRTIISTLHPRNPRYIQGPALGSYAIEQYVTEDFLGLRACHIHLRHGTDFIRDAISRLPLWSKLKFQYDAETANDSITPDLVQKVQDLVWNRDSIDESFAILTTSASLIGRLFNDILSRAKSYPLIISGDFMLRDNGLLVFLLLLLLEAPFSAIENAYMRVAEDFSLRSKEAGITETPVTQARARNRKHWARELLRRLTARYGSMSAYFDSAGVNEIIDWLVAELVPPVLRGTADVDRIEAPVTAKAYMMCAFASFGGIYFGYDIGWISGVMGMKYAIHTFTGLPYNTPAEDFVISASDKSLITSILSAGTFFGALAAGDIADFIGRRTTIIIGCLIFMVGVIMEIVATSVSLLSAGRFIAGLGVGFESAIVILYMSEICPRKVRGALIACYQFCITIGLLLASCVVYGTQDRMDSGSYRIPIGIQFAWALILGGGIACLPESPRYFVKQGQLEKAAKALASVRGQPVDSQFVQQELAEIVANHEYELSVVPQGSYLSSWANCFKGSLWKANSNLRRTILGTSLQMMQQWTGVNFIFFFGTTFFQQLGSISNPFLIGLITTLVNVLSTPISFWTIERFGRRPLLIWGALGMLCCQFLTAILGTAISSDNDVATKAQIAFICLAIAFFASTWGPGAWVLIGEIFPLPIRSRGVGLSTASNWLWNTIIAVITPYMVHPDKGNLGPKVFFVWGTLCTCACIYAYFLVPETKGLSLEQVDKMLEEVNPRNSAGWKPTTTFANEMGLTKGGVSSEQIVVDVEKRGSVH